MLEGARTDARLFDPWSEQDQVIFPGLNGGANWGGAAFDPSGGFLVREIHGCWRVVSSGQASGRRQHPVRAAVAEVRVFLGQEPLPVPAAAVGLTDGDRPQHWRIPLAGAPLGEFEELRARNIPKTGTPNLGGPIVTAGGLVFIAATSDRNFRAFDKDTGQELWVTSLPASGFAMPRTHIGPRNKKQYVVIAAGGGNKYDSKFDSKLIAFALP